MWIEGNAEKVCTPIPKSEILFLRSPFYFTFMVRIHLVLTTGIIIPWQQKIESLMKQNDIRLQVEIDMLLAHGSNHPVSQKHTTEWSDLYV